MKYFFLSEGWIIGRVWASDGLWQVTAWRRQPEISRMNISLIEKDEVLWLYNVEDTILTIEVKPTPNAKVDTQNHTIGNVVLKRLMNAEQVLERLASTQTQCSSLNFESVVT